MSKSTLIGVVTVLILLVGGAALLSRNSDDKAASPATNSSANKTDNASEQTASTESVTAGSVDIKNMAFTPSQISVQKGAKVTWTNNDTVAHTVTDDLTTVGGPDSESIAPGGTYSFTFNKAGSYQYHCTFHSSMRGTIVVK